MSEPNDTCNTKKTPSAYPNLPISTSNLSIGSATGNPRNKCALKPGHSLMDWIRLGNSGIDISGTNGANISVSKKELIKHCNKDDAWMAIRGNVYNVTRYMDFHPGGTEELMRGVGKDATKLFEEVHAWVNFEQLLKKCLVGPLENVIKLDENFFKPSIDNLVPQLSICDGKINTKSKPRFDWIQKQSNLTLYFYTTQFCNPGLVLKRKNAKLIEFRIGIQNYWHLYIFNFFNEVNWPPASIKISSESGRIEINLTKILSTLWTSYGTLEEIKDHKLVDDRYESEIVQLQNFNSNSIALRLQLKNEVIMVPPVGYHLSFTCYIKEKEVIRSYTPVPRRYSPLCTENINDLYFLLKIYTNGLITTYINDLKLKSSILVSQPRGNILLHNFLGHTRIALIAAGSGITPMFSIIDHLLTRNKQRIEKVNLWFFNSALEDVWCMEHLNKISMNDDRLNIKYLISKFKDNVNYEEGHVSEELLMNTNNPASELYSTFICTCGPPAFNTITRDILNKINVPTKNMFFFES